MTMNTIEITAENLETTLSQPGIVLLDFWAPWCGPCRQFAPVFEQAAARHPDARFGKINTEEQPELAAAFGIQAIPTLAVFRDNILLLQQAGMLPGPALDQLVEKVRSLDMDDVRRKVAEEEAHGGHDHAHGPDCDHDHAHGPDCDHDHDHDHDA